jgi:hypothetical protein
MRSTRILIAAAYCLPAALLLWIKTAPSRPEDSLGDGMLLFGLLLVTSGFSGSAFLTGLLLGGGALKRDPTLRTLPNWTVLGLAALGLGVFATELLHLLPR